MLQYSSTLKAIHWLKEQKLEEKNILQRDEIQAVYEYSYIMLENNLSQMEQYVVPELKEKSYQIMCDFWGKDFVDKIEKLRK